MRRASVAMTSEVDIRARAHLLRGDGQEDICLAMYVPSTGERRSAAILTELVLPLNGERRVHGNASFSGSYVVRAASQAAANGLGVALMHSHPFGRGWQATSRADEMTEDSFARVAQTITGHPLVGMTLAGDHAWSARIWDCPRGRHDAESVRVVGPTMRASFNDALRPPPPKTSAQVRTVSAWGELIQQDLARLRVLVVGVGSVGLDVAIRLVQAGIESVSVMDFDTVEEVNLDRLITATRADAALFRSKVDIALRAMRSATTAASSELIGYDLSICEPEGQRAALDYDIIFSCVDRPWARAVLSQLAYSDLIPVIDGGLAIDPFPDRGMRNATWRAHVVTPGRPCLQCNGQIDGAEVARDRIGLFDDPAYMRTTGGRQLARENVSLLVPSVTASLLSQFVSLVVAPGGIGVPAPLRFSLSAHSLEHLPAETQGGCGYEIATAVGDFRSTLVGRHAMADAERTRRDSNARRLRVRVGRAMQATINSASLAIQRRCPG